MDASYDKLFKILIDKKMQKNELAATAGISYSSIARLKRQENINVSVLIKICRALDCKMDDIMDILPGQNKESGEPDNAK